MTKRRHYFRSVVLAFAALVAVQFGTREASAAANPQAMRSCCVKRACRGSCCGMAVARVRRELVGRGVALAPAVASLQSAGERSCECRSGEPAAPAARPATPPLRSRFELAQSGGAPMAPHTRVAIELTTRHEPPSDRAGIHFSLRTTHLLI
jgi:hypothetical protein